MALLMRPAIEHPVRRCLALALAAALGACSLPVADKESDAISRAFYSEVRTGADLSRDPHVDPTLTTPEAQAALAGARSWAPGAAPTKINNAGWSYNSNAGQGAQAQLSHAYAYPGGATVHVQTVLRKLPGQTQWTIVGFQANADSGPAVAVGVPPKGPGDD
jgi:hypothetical protein